jgi:hypothetical protein
MRIDHRHAGSPVVALVADAIPLTLPDAAPDGAGFAAFAFSVSVDGCLRPDRAEFAERTVCI